MTFEVHINDKHVVSALEKKSNELSKELEKYKKKLLNLYRNAAIREAPRRTGRLKSSHRGEWVGDKGIVYADEHVAPYAKYVLKGTRYMKANKWNERAVLKAAPEYYRINQELTRWMVKL